MIEWGRRRKWRMRTEGRKGRQCQALSPNSPRCYVGGGNWPGCSVHNHWTTGCVCVGRRTDDNRKRQSRNKEWDKLLK